MNHFRHAALAALIALTSPMAMAEYDPFSGVAGEGLSGDAARGLDSDIQALKRGMRDLREQLAIQEQRGSANDTIAKEDFIIQNGSILDGLNASQLTHYKPVGHVNGRFVVSSNDNGEVLHMTVSKDIFELLVRNNTLQGNVSALKGEL